MSSKWALNLRAGHIIYGWIHLQLSTIMSVYLYTLLGFYLTCPNIFLFGFFSPPPVSQMKEECYKYFFFSLAKTFTDDFFTCLHRWRKVSVKNAPSKPLSHQDKSFFLTDERKLRYLKRLHRFLSHHQRRQKQFR